MADKQRVAKRRRIQDRRLDIQPIRGDRYPLSRTRRELLHFQYLAFNVFLGLQDHLQVTSDTRHHLFRSSLGLITDFLFPAGGRGNVSAMRDWK